MARLLPKFLDHDPLRLLHDIVRMRLEVEKEILNSNLDEGAQRDGEELLNIVFPDLSEEEKSYARNFSDQAHMKDLRENVATLERVLTLMEARALDELEEVFSDTRKRYTEDLPMMRAMFCTDDNVAEHPQWEFTFKKEPVFLDFALSLIALAKEQQLFVSKMETPD